MNVKLLARCWVPLFDESTKNFSTEMQASESEKNTLKTERKQQPK